TSLIGSCIDGLKALAQRAKPRTQAHPHPAPPWERGRLARFVRKSGRIWRSLAMGRAGHPRSQRGKPGWGARCSGPAIWRMGPRLRDRIVGLSLRSPLGKEIARRAAIKPVIEVREVIDALH